MARMKFLCDAERCIECNACVTACKNEHEVPWGINRRRVVTLNDGKPGERSISMACMHCTDAPCMAVCPVDCFYKTAEGVVLHSKDLCIGCGYCFYACPFGAPQYPQVGNFGSRGKMDKCTFCAGGPEDDMTPAEYSKYAVRHWKANDFNHLMGSERGRSVHPRWCGFWFTQHTGKPALGNRKIGFIPYRANRDLAGISEQRGVRRRAPFTTWRSCPQTKSNTLNQHSRVGEVPDVERRGMDEAACAALQVQGQTRHPCGALIPNQAEHPELHVR